MQPINADPRAAADPTQVLALLQGDSAVRITYGAKWLDKNLNILGDLTSFMSGDPTISSDISAAPQRTCTLYFDSNAPINYVTDFVQPWMMITDLDTGFSATFDLGVYTMTTPERDNSALPSVLEVAGSDLLYFLNQTPDDSYQSIVGTNPITDAIEFIGLGFPGANVNFTPTTTTLGQDLTWILGESDPVTGSSTTWLGMVNDLLQAAGYLPLWIDWEGTFQMHPYVDPTSLPSEYIFDVSAPDNIVAEARSSEQDLYSVPNRWIFIIQNSETQPVPGTSMWTYVDENPNRSSSYTNRGIFINKITSVAAADYATLVLTGQQTVQTDLSPAETVSWSISPFPLLWHRDNIEIFDPNMADIAPELSPSRRMMILTWDLHLNGGTDTTFTAQTVATI